MKGILTRLLVEDFDKVFEFYTEIMGLTASWGAKGDIYASFNIGDDIVLAIYSAHSMENDMDFYQIDNKKHSNAAVLTLSVDDVDKTYQELLAKNITILNEPKNMTGWGIRVIYLRDPAGNLIELSSDLPEEEWSQGLKDANKKYEK